MIETQTARPSSRANAFMTSLLRSPLHGLLDRSTMLITVTGRTTGAAYTLPVNYVRDGDALVVLSRADRTWWRNARGAEVTLHLDGHDLRGHAEVIEEPAAVAEAIRDLIGRLPAFRRRFGVTLHHDGKPAHPERVEWLVENRVVVRVTVEG